MKDYPNPLKETLLRLFGGIPLLAIYTIVNSVYSFNYKYVLTEEFKYHSSVVQFFLMFLFFNVFQRLRYYSAFLLDEMGSTASGLCFNGYDKETSYYLLFIFNFFKNYIIIEKPLWNKVEMIRIR